jgi:hypothetical protein
MLVAAALLLLGQTTSDPVLLAQRVGEREYTFCISFTDPFPESNEVYYEGFVLRPTKVFVSRTRKLNAGSRVLVTGQRDGYAAIFDPRTGNEGCVVASALEMRKPAKLSNRADWIGNWEKIGRRKTNKDGIDIRPARGGSLRILGGASYKALAYMPDDTTNFGEIDARGIIRDGTIEVRVTGAFPCRYSLHLVGAYLVVLDRDAELCNGYNVTFSGVYRRSPKH